MKPHPITERLDVNGADLSSARFTDCNLTGWHLEDVHLSGAVLRNLNLSGATLSNCRLRGVTIDDVPLTDRIAAYQRTLPS